MNPDSSTGERKRTNLTVEQRKEATRRVLAGEKARVLAIEFGVTRACISLLKAVAIYPERYNQKRQTATKFLLTDEELAAFRQAIETSNPYELGLDPPSLKWCMDHGRQLAQRMFGKPPSVRVLKECMAPVLRPKHDPLLRRPQPPLPHHSNQISGDLAKNEDFMSYYLSPLAEQLAQREYEFALAQWVELYGDATEIDPINHREERDTENSNMTRKHKPQFAQPVGKHSKKKGSAFTPSKKKRRKKG